MGAPISGDDHDLKPISDHLHEASSEEGDPELDDRISESATQAIETIVDSGIPETTPSESTQSDLLNRVEYEPREGFITAILVRIQRSVTGILRNLFSGKSHRRSRNVDKTPNTLLEETNLPELAEDPEHFNDLRNALIACRSFFSRVYLRLFSFLRREHPSSPIDLCGTDPLSPEATVAFSFLLRCACKWVAEILVKEGLPLEKEEEERTYNALSFDSIGSMESISLGLSELLYSHVRTDGLASIRGVTKIVCFPPFGGMQSFSAIENLSQYDGTRNYSQVMAWAIRLDELAKRGTNETLLIKDLLYMVRQDRSRELGEFIQMWSGEYAAEVNYDIVSAILETNLPVLEEDFRTNPEGYQKKLNYIICKLLCDEQLSIIEPKD